MALGGFLLDIRGGVFSFFIEGTPSRRVVSVR